MPKISKQTLSSVISPIIATIIWNLGVVYFFITSDQQLFNDFVRNFGLRGSWNLFNLDLQATINGSLKTYTYHNGPLILFLTCVIGNIFLSAFYITKTYRAKEKSSILPPPPQN